MKELEEIGLTQREIKVYEALLGIGESSVGAVIKKAGVPGSKIYETLDKLKQKGMVSSVIKENRLYFKASDPSFIINMLEDKKRHIEEAVLPKLKALQIKEKSEREATIYEGFSGFKAIYEKILRTLKDGEILFVLGAPKDQERFEGYLLDFNKRRINLGIRMKIIYHLKAIKFGKKREKMKFTEVNYLREDFPMPAWIDIFGDYVVIFDISPTPIAFLVRDKNMAINFKKYFEIVVKKGCIKK